MAGPEDRIAVLGGCGHVGLPLAVMFASRGLDVSIVDVDAQAVERTNAGVMSFHDQGTEQLLRTHAGRNLRATTRHAALAESGAVICVVGTPLDTHLNPRADRLLSLIGELSPHLRPGQLFVLRSTVYPGATERVARFLEERVPGIDVAFCPERVAQGRAAEEIAVLPQIVSGTTPRACERAQQLFGRICPDVVPLAPLEAELGKLFCNAWRYATFAIANQFYALCAASGVDYARVHAAITDGYPRMAGLPMAGFAAGPCLFKDTMQLAAFFDGEFSLGQVAMSVNEGFPRTLMNQLRPLGLGDKCAGLLGMTFKADNDDSRESLAFKMKKLLALECRAVLCTDEYLREDWLVPLEEVLERADFLIVCAPHRRYRTLEPRQPMLDPWNALGKGALLR